jgi:hypothetical protein
VGVGHGRAVRDAVRPEVREARKLEHRLLGGRLGLRRIRARSLPTFHKCLIVNSFDNKIADLL